MEFGLGFSYAGLHIGLLVLPSCGSYSGPSVGLGLRYRSSWFGSSGGSFLGFYLWFLGGLKVEV